MNSVPSAEVQAVQLVDIIDFKWLMAHEGHHIHVERLQRDAVYAADCLQQAAGSSNESLRSAAQRLQRAWAAAAPAA
jgi:hypothetical protein